MPQVVRCPEGHFYDALIFAECPHCRDQLDQRNNAAYAENGQARAGAQTAAGRRFTRNVTRTEDRDEVVNLAREYVREQTRRYGLRREDFIRSVQGEAGAAGMPGRSERTDLLQKEQEALSESLVTEALVDKKEYTAPPSSEKQGNGGARTMQADGIRSENRGNGGARTMQADGVPSENQENEAVPGERTEENPLSGQRTVSAAEVPAISPGLPASDPSQRKTGTDDSALRQKDDELTVRYRAPQQSTYFATGWVACVDGPDKGHVFSLYQGYHAIGRGLKAQVRVTKDPAITGDVHGYLVYDEKKNRFHLVPEGMHSVFLNGKLMASPREIVTGDRFGIGNSVFLFVALCKGDMKWDVTP